MSGHTPGEWIVLVNYGQAWAYLPRPISEYVKIARVGADYDIMAIGRETEGMDKANAALIASAPDLLSQRDELLAVCKALIDDLDECDAELEDERSTGDWLQPNSLALARAIIARIEGAQSKSG